MGKLWITADWHLGETRMRLMQRPFAGPADMLDVLVARHNERVAPEDDVIVVGDAVVKDASPAVLKLIDRFHGRKLLIRGNHDEAFSDAQLKPHFADVVGHGKHVEINVGGLLCRLTHYPTLGSDRKFNLVGHVHAAWKFQLNALNVGVDVHHFAPVAEDDVPFFLAIRKAAMKPLILFPVSSTGYAFAHERQRLNSDLHRRLFPAARR